MRNYEVKKGFMAYQFGEPSGSYSIGIACKALKEAGSYKCIIGKEKREVVVSYDQALELVNRFGQDNVIRNLRGKQAFIIPIFLLK
jgi:hypothetical protein